MSFIQELKRRNVFRAGLAYLLIAWVVLQAADFGLDLIDAPNWIVQSLFLLATIGLPLTLLGAWVFEVTPEGIKRERDVSREHSITPQTRRRLDRVIIVLLTLIIAILISQNFAPSDSDNSDPALADIEDTALTSEPLRVDDGKQSIAVLPFDDFSQDGSEDYFARGISEELLNFLARVDGLRVASRTSAFAYKDEGKSISDIAAALKVAHILEGSVRKSGDTLRITAQLIDTSNDEHLWSQSYDRPLTAENLFQIQDEIADAIVSSLKGQLTMKPPVASGRAVSLEAYELYLQAREDHNKRLPGPLAAAEAGFRKVTELDPEFAPAYSGLADTYLLMQEYAGMDREQAQRLATPNVERALALDPNSAEALTSASLLARAAGRPDEALDLATRAIASNPNYSVAYHRQGLAYESKGEFAKALESFQRGLFLDPASAALQGNISHTHLALGNHTEARATAEALIRAQPDSYSGYWALADTLYELGQYEPYHFNLKEAEARNPTNRPVRYALYELYLYSGLFDLARNYADTLSSEVLTYLQEGDLESAERLMEGVFGPERATMAYFQGDPERAMQMFEPLLPFILPSGDLVTEQNAADAAFFAIAYHRFDKSKAEPLRLKLDKYFSGKTASEFSTQGVLLAGLTLQLLKDEPSAAVLWRDRLFELNHVSAPVPIPLWKELEALPSYATDVARIEEILRQRREAIAEQLANAPENWVLNDLSKNEDE